MPAPSLVMLQVYPVREATSEPLDRDLEGSSAACRSGIDPSDGSKADFSLSSPIFGSTAGASDRSAKTRLLMVHGCRTLAVLPLAQDAAAHLQHLRPRSA